MIQQLALIGFGEAGSTFARAAGWRGNAAAFDIAPAQAAAMAECGVRCCSSAGEALGGAEVALCLVTADQALAAAAGAAPHLSPGTLYCDMNSVAPETKRQAAKLISAAGGRYVDAAVMAPVCPQHMAVPLLLSGPDAGAGQSALSALGFSNVRVAGNDVGRASTIKMLRSVMYKGVEALTAECLLACEAAGVTDEVLASFGNDWSDQADYRLDRMMVHGTRRSAEMAEVVKTLESLGVDSLMSRGTRELQARIGALGITSPPVGHAAKLERLRP